MQTSPLEIIADANYNRSVLRGRAIDERKHGCHSAYQHFSRLMLPDCNLQPRMDYQET